MTNLKISAKLASNTYNACRKHCDFRVWSDMSRVYTGLKYHLGYHVYTKRNQKALKRLQILYIVLFLLCEVIAKLSAWYSYISLPTLLEKSESIYLLGIHLPVTCSAEQHLSFAFSMVLPVCLVDSKSEGDGVVHPFVTPKSVSSGRFPGVGGVSVALMDPLECPAQEPPSLPGTPPHNARHCRRHPS